MKHSWNLGAIAMLLLLCLSACSESSKYPDEYVGFDQIERLHKFNPKVDEEEIQLKVIAASKSMADREATITIGLIPGQEVALRLLDKKVIIPANKTSAFVRIRLFPKQIKKNTTVRVACSPKIENAKKSLISLRLEAK